MGREREDRRKGVLIKLHNETERKQLTAVSLVQISLKMKMTRRIVMISKHSGKKKKKKNHWSNSIIF